MGLQQQMELDGMGMFQQEMMMNDNVLRLVLNCEVSGKRN